MYVVSDYTFTPDTGAGYEELVVAGVYGIERFVSIENATRNDVLYSAVEGHIGSIVVADDGVETTVRIYGGEKTSEAGDKIRILIYDPTPTSSGPTSNVTVTNWPTSQNINGAVTVTNEIEIANDAGNPVPVTGTVDVNNFPATQTVDGTVSVDNFPALQDVQVTNFPATQEVTQGTTPWAVSGLVTTETQVQSFPETGVDAFGRLKVSNPYTLFDSSNRYAVNPDWNTDIEGGGAYIFNTNGGYVTLTLGGNGVEHVIRETKRVFSYQPGKSLLVMNTFTFGPPNPFVRQRVGYYGEENGYYVELGDTAADLSFVERSSVSGPTTNTPVPQAAWNVDPMDGTGPSGITLDTTRAQILWMDIEWLGVGTVRMGFVIDGVFYTCHKFHHANDVYVPYIATACLPIRYELRHIDPSVVVSSSLTQICSTVISEGGYVLTGAQKSVSTPITAPYQLTTAGTYYPVITARLKGSRLDAISLITGLSLLGAGNNETYAWRVVSGSTTTGGTWDTPSATSSVEYNLTGATVNGGTVIASGFTNASNQGSPIIDILKGSIFANQFERNSFSVTPTEISLQVAPANNTQEIFASINWEEVTS
jgi:hypothetical protein